MLKIKKRTLKNVVSLIGATIIGFFLIEIIVMIFSPQMLYNQYHPDNPDLERQREPTLFGLRPKPNLDIIYYAEDFKLATIKNNNKGFRDEKDYALDKNGKKRIILFGDSFVYGSGNDQDEVIHVYMRDLFKEYEIYNFGIPGSGTDIQYFLLKQEGPLYKPDIVIFFIFQNDFNDNIIADSTEIVLRPKFIIDFSSEENILILRDRAELSWKEEPENVSTLDDYYNQSGYEEVVKRIVDADLKIKAPDNKIVLFFYKHSHLYNLVNNAIKNTKSNPSPVVIESFKKHPTDRFLAANSIMCRLIKRINDEVDSWDHSSRLIITYIPHRIQVEEDLLNKHNYDPEEHDLRLPNKIIEECTKRYDITFLDFTQKFQELTEKGKKIYNPHGDHWSPYGTQVASKELYEFLKKEELI